MLRRDVELQMSRIFSRRESDPLVPGYASTREIEEVDSEADDLPICRICLENEAPHDNKLISPCSCKGTQQFVHRQCLDHWRSTKEGYAFSHCTTCQAQFHFRVVKIPDHAWRQINFKIFVAHDVCCVLLAVQFVIGLLGGLVYSIDKEGVLRNFFNNTWDRLLSNHTFACYYSAGAVLFFMLSGIIGLIVYCTQHASDIHVASCQNCFCCWSFVDCVPVSTESLVLMAIAFVVISTMLGIAYGFLVASGLLQALCQNYYQIYAKKGLTKEYVVADLHGHYTVPRLDPRHEERLRSLELL